MIRIDSNRRIGYLRRTIVRIRIERVHICRSQRKTNLHRLLLPLVVITQIESASLSLNQAKLMICSEMPQLRRRVVSVVANLVAEDRPQADGVHVAVAPRRLPHLLLASRRLQPSKPRIRVALDPRIAAVANLIAEVDSRAFQPDR